MVRRHEQGFPTSSSKGKKCMVWTSTRVPAVRTNMHGTSMEKGPQKLRKMSMAQARMSIHVVKANVHGTSTEGGPWSRKKGG
jgi:hypothetical protein